jgi:hypothetical protein
LKIRIVNGVVRIKHERMDAITHKIVDKDECQFCNSQPNVGHKLEDLLICSFHYREINEMVDHRWSVRIGM